MPKKPKAKVFYQSYHWKVRRYEHTPFVSVWLIGVDGTGKPGSVTAHSGRMYGVMLKDAAKEMMKATGLKIVWEGKSPYTMTKQTRIANQKAVRKGFIDFDLIKEKK